MEQRGKLTEDPRVLVIASIEAGLTTKVIVIAITTSHNAEEPFHNLAPAKRASEFSQTVIVNDALCFQ